MKDFLQNENIISRGDYESNTLNKSVTVPVANLSENHLSEYLRLAEIAIAECIENKSIEINSACSNNFHMKKIN